MKFHIGNLNKKGQTKSIPAHYFTWRSIWVFKHNYSQHWNLMQNLQKSLT